MNDSVHLLQTLASSQCVPEKRADIREKIRDQGRGDGTVARRSRRNRGGAQQVSETERVRHLWDKLAPKYDRVIRFPERMLFQGGRECVCSQAKGDVLEIAVGTGLNFPHYPSDVRLTGIDLSPQMVEVARQRARELNKDVDLRVGDAQHLEFPDQSFDTVVCTLSLCSIPDDRMAVAEVERVLRPEGRVPLLEHVRSPNLVVRGFHRILNPITVRLQGDHMLREPLDHLRVEGFDIETVKRSKGASSSECRR